MHRSCLATALHCALALSVGTAAFEASAQNTPPEPTAPEPDLSDPPEPAPSQPAPEPSDSEGAPTPPPPPPSEGDFAGGGADTSDDPLSYESTEDEDSIYSRNSDEAREFSVRFDPLNWLLLGRLGLELEMTVWKFITVELVPVFVTASRPIALNYARLDDTLTQSSRGIGLISGASLGAGFWIFGEPFSGYVIRLNFTNYAYTYEAKDGGGVFDRVKFTERRMILFFGTHNRFGVFTFAGGLGLGLELNQQERCGLSRVRAGSGERVIGANTSDCDGRQQIALERDLSERADLNGPLHPIYFEARFSIGVVF